MNYTTADRDGPILTLPKYAEKAATLLPHQAEVLAALETHDVVVLLGGRASGKSWLMQFLRDNYPHHGRLLLRSISQYVLENVQPKFKDQWYWGIIKQVMGWFGKTLEESIELALFDEVLPSASTVVADLALKGTKKVVITITPSPRVREWVEQMQAKGINLKVVFGRTADNHFIPSEYLKQAQDWPADERGEPDTATIVKDQVVNTMRAIAQQEVQRATRPGGEL